MCIFCQIAKGEIPSYKLYEDDKVLAFLDISQITKGHTLVIPKEHYDDLLSVEKETLDRMIEVSQKLAIELKNKFNAKGINLLNNNGEVAGQTVKHVHFHIIPRYDENDAIIIDNKESGINAEEVYKEYTK